VSNTTSIEIDKTGTTAATVLMAKIIAVNASAFEGPLQLAWGVCAADWTNVAYVINRLGTDASNYNEWKLDPADFSTTGWTRIASSFIESTQTGNGLNMSDITYLALGVQMDGAANTTAAPIQFDFVHLLSAPFATPGSAITVDAGNVANVVRMLKLGIPSNANVATGAGDADSGTQRQLAANDDPGVALLGKMYPNGSEANADSAAGNGSWTAVTLAAGTVYADVTCAGKTRIAAPDSTPSGAKANEYQPNITVRLATPFGKLWAYGVGAAHAITTTSFTRT